MQLGQLRAAHRRIELGGLVALPAGYFTLMAAGVFLFAVQYVAFSLLLVILVILQRPRKKASRAKRRQSERPLEPVPRAVIDEADACFLQGARAAALVGAAGYFLFLAGLDLDLRMTLAGARDPLVVFAAAAVGFAVAAFGRDLAVRRAWKPFASRNPGIWVSPVDLNGGRTAWRAAAFLEWRASIDPGPAPT